MLSKKFKHGPERSIHLKIGPLKYHGGNNRTRVFAKTIIAPFSVYETAARPSRSLPVEIADLVTIFNCRISKMNATGILLRVRHATVFDLQSRSCTLFYFILKSFYAKKLKVMRSKTSSLPVSKFHFSTGSMSYRKCMTADLKVQFFYQQQRITGMTSGKQTRFRKRK